MFFHTTRSLVLSPSWNKNFSFSCNLQIVKIHIKLLDYKDLHNNYTPLYINNDQRNVLTKCVDLCFFIHQGLFFFGRHEKKLFFFFFSCNLQVVKTHIKLLDYKELHNNYTPLYTNNNEKTKERWMKLKENISKQ